jgi:hypothetical protein
LRGEFPFTKTKGSQEVVYEEHLAGIYPAPGSPIEEFGDDPTPDNRPNRHSRIFFSPESRVFNPESLACGGTSGLYGAAALESMSRGQKFFVLQSLLPVQYPAIYEEA